MLHLSPLFDGYILLLSALLGCVMGSFLNCFAWRLVHGESIAKGRSHCAACGHLLGVADLIPVASWLFLKGKCRYCGEQISPRYMLTELLCGIVYATVVWRYDVSVEALRMLWLLSVLLAASLVDWEEGWIPDRFLAAGLFGVALFTGISGGVRELANGLFGAAALFIPMLWLVLAFDKRLGQETMGGGDLKLIALLGFAFGWQKGLLLLFLSSVLGLLLAYGTGKHGRGASLPFGPALSAAAWLTALGGDAFLSWYLHLF